jgi:hypothetical protein
MLAIHLAATWQVAFMRSPRGADLLGGLCQNLRCHALTAEGVVHKGCVIVATPFSAGTSPLPEACRLHQAQNTAFLMLEIHIVHLGPV